MSQATPTQVELPVPEAGKDLPAQYSFNGWHRALNPHVADQWNAYLTWNKPGFPPMMQMVTVYLAEAVSMKPKALMRLVQDRVAEAIRLNEISVSELGWGGTGGSAPTFSNFQS